MTDTSSPRTTPDRGWWVQVTGDSKVPMQCSAGCTRALDAKGVREFIRALTVVADVLEEDEAEMARKSEVKEAAHVE